MKAVFLFFVIFLSSVVAVYKPQGDSMLMRADESVDKNINKDKMVGFNSFIHTESLASIGMKKIKKFEEVLKENKDEVKDEVKEDVKKDVDRGDGA